MSPLLGSLADTGARGFGMFLPSGSTNGMISIATITAAGGETSLTFSSIPQTYTDLHVRCLTREVTNQSGAVTTMRFNGDSGGNYAYHRIYANGTGVGGVGSASSGSPYISFNTADSSYSASIFSGIVVNVADYTSTTKYKTYQSIYGNETNSTAGMHVGTASGVWMNTAAITSLSIVASGAGGFAAGTVVALYGIKAAL